MSILQFARRAASAGAMALALSAGIAPAQEVEPALPAPDALATDDRVPDVPTATPDEVPAGTLVHLRIDEDVNSKTHKTGDWYAITLLEPIMLGERTIVPAGTPGRGQVVHAAKSGWGGKAGELILGARYLEYQGQQIPLRGMKLGGVGGNNEGLAFGATIAGGLVAMPLVFALNGKNANIPAGMYATAKLAVALTGEPSTAAQATVDPAAAVSAAPGDAIDTNPTGEMGEPKQ
ncbi:hypothetical protein SAMN06295984_0795 [Sphingopyxis terrae subsp. ummariensis]|uniref:Uncharacterized protein n=2 Tax=Sphingomonadaceae TaxID=41297 RepID=A0A1Y6ER57_9SPHN|nr:hypothetical protein SAMN06295984_0795 [Sphingopyxis terrae subsp. ummariensis]